MQCRLVGDKKGAAALSAGSSMNSLSCVFDCSAFPDDIDLDLSGVFDLFLDLFAYISCKQYHIVIFDLFGLDYDTNLTACLNCKASFNTFK